MELINQQLLTNYRLFLNGIGLGYATNDVLLENKHAAVASIKIGF